MYADSAADFTLALVLTVLFGLLTYLAWRRRGVGALLKGVGITMLPLALWLSHTLRLASDIVDDVGNWATGLVFSPRVWVGIIVAAVAVVIYLAGVAVSRRGATGKAVSTGSTTTGSITRASTTKGSTAKKGGSGDPELDEIEAMLRKRGISLSADSVLALALARPPTLGRGRLVCVDGPAGSGKTTLAAALAARHPDSAVVHVDDLLDGWDGLPGVTEQMPGLLEPLAGGRPGHYRRYDWLAGGFAETVTVEPTSLLVLEGVGAGDRLPAARATVLVWVEVAADVRLERGLARDGEPMRAHWQRWMLEEQRHFLDQDTRARADVIV